MMEGSSTSDATGDSSEPPVRRKREHHPGAAGGDNDKKKKKGSSSSSSIKPRPYQVELLEDALCENTIVNLGTGAGKTFIAVMLIKELSFQILDRPFGPTSKRTVFLVTTVPLVKQQAQYLEKHTMLDVGQFIGAMNVDSWTKQQWWEKMSQYHVLVMTATIFKNILHSGFIHLKNVNLLVFDECHHAIKNHDYVQIMKVFDSVPDFSDHPRVLGLSASLLPNKCKPGELAKSIKALEQRLKCRCQTARDYEEVVLHATDPNEKTIVYNSTPLPHLMDQTDKLRGILSQPLSHLESLPKASREDPCYKISKANLDDCLHILENLGIWCARNCAEQCIEGLQATLSSEVGAILFSDRQKALLGLALTNIDLFLKKANKLHHEEDIDVTYKVQLLLQCLEEEHGRGGEGGGGGGGGGWRRNGSGKRKMLGIVFVERRMTAVLLKRMLDLLTPNYPGLSAIKSDYVVGHNAVKSYTSLRRESHMSDKKQDQVLQRFRKEEINLLIATSVVEEGIDVPRCNLVIRFDFPPNLRSYIQSKGRARAKPSKYILMLEDTKQVKATADLNGYQIVERDLREICKSRCPPKDEEFLEFLEKAECNIYAPYGLEAGVRATLSSSLSFLYKYCQRFSDRFTSFSPVFKYESRVCRKDIPELRLEAGQREFRCTIQLPISCPLKEKITGHWMPKARLAEKSAALEAIRVLHKAGELDEHLKPVTIDPDSDEEGEEGGGVKEKHAGTERRAKYYPDETATTLQDGLPVTGSDNYLYILLMEEANSDIHKFPFSRQPPGGPHFGLAILTRKSLPCKDIPEFLVYEKRMEIKVKLVELPTRVTAMSEDELHLLKQAHQALFESVLRLSSPLLSCSFTDTSTLKSLLIVPVNIWQMESPPLAHIDFHMARKIIDCSLGKFAPLEWPFQFSNATITKIYENSRDILEILEVDEGTSPGDKFPIDRYTSYVDYFQKKYDLTIRNLGQPALVCKRIGFTESRLNLIKSRYKNTHGEESEAGGSKSNHEILFPEISQLYPLPASLAKVIRCLPSMLYRIESFLSVNELRLQVTLGTGIGRVCTTKADLLQGYKDYGGEKLETRWNLDSDSGAATCPCPDNPVIVRGPGNTLLLQAVTLRSANDSINNERLETLGDSFLKLATSVFLFCDRPTAYEGRLTSARMRRIGNWNLFQMAKRQNLTGKILSKTFMPTGQWLPPCFKFTEQMRPGEEEEEEEEEEEGCEVVRGDKLSDSKRQYVYHRLTDKGIADFMESLMGAYLVAGGMEAALRFMKWSGLKITHKRDQDMPSDEEDEGERKKTPSAEDLTTPCSKRTRQSPVPDIDGNLLIEGSSNILREHFGPPPQSLFDPTQTEMVEKLLSISTSQSSAQSLESLPWRFNDRALLLQTLTHSSYQNNRVTDCYQRLEFLGDAVLDYLITAQIYEKFPDFDPGKITDMRSALVNNNLFAELAVRLKLHKYLLHCSPLLFKLIPEYEEFISENSEHGETLVAAAMEEDSDSEDEEEEDGGGGDRVVEPPKVLGDLLEGLAGAIFMDSGMDLQAVWDTLGHLFLEKIEKFKDDIPMPPIKKLHNLYRVDVKLTRTGQKRVCCTIKYEGEVVAAESASSKKAAKNAAARTALRKFSAKKLQLNTPVNNKSFDAASEPDWILKTSELKNVTEEGYKHVDEEFGFIIEVPKGAIPNGMSLVISVALSIYGPFRFPKNVRRVSPIVWVCVKDFENFQFLKPVKVSLQHCLNLNCADNVDTFRLHILKAGHSRDHSGLFSFQGADGEIEQGPTSDYFTLSTTHFCYLCLVSNVDPQTLSRIQYCLTPYQPLLGKKDIRIFVSFFLDACLTSIEKQCGEGYEKLSPRLFHWKGENCLTIDFTEPQNWLLGLESSEEILASDVDFMEKDPDDLRREEQQGIYPPRFTIRFHPLFGAHPAKVHFKFSGADRKLAMDILILPDNHTVDQPNLQPPAQHTASLLASPPPAVQGRETEPRSLLPLGIFMENVAVQARTKWRHFGIMIDIPPDILDSYNGPDCLLSFSKVYDFWARRGSPQIDWKTIVSVLESDMVDEKKLADDIRKKFL